MVDGVGAGVAADPAVRVVGEEADAGCPVAGPVFAVPAHVPSTAWPSPPRLRMALRSMVSRAYSASLSPGLISMTIRFVVQFGQPLFVSISLSPWVALVPHAVRMRKLIVAAGLVAALTAVACGSGESESGSAAPDVSVPSAAPVKSFTPEQVAYLAALKKIDPGLVANESRALSRAESSCQKVKDGDLSRAKLIDQVRQRLSGGDATIDADQAERALKLMEKHIC